jgi:peptidoglycan/xylan/chitin deacetylase (PgdA/CDA1 family)
VPEVLEPAPALPRGTRLKRTVLRALGVVQRLPAGAADSVLLTFDDGPRADVTPRVLDRLRDHGARAVFFVVGDRIGSGGPILRRALAEGHRIGNHTYSHPLGRTPTLLPYLRDVAKCQQTVVALTGQKPTLFRPPLGSITPATLLAPRLMGLTTVRWSVDLGDWRLRTQEDAVECGERLDQATRPRDILLLHDDNPCVLAVLDCLLPLLKRRGFDLSRAAGLL